MDILLGELNAIILLVIYYFVFISVLILLKLFSPLSREIIRKSYHFFYGISLALAVYLFENWYIILSFLTGFYLLAFIYLKIENRYLNFKIIDFDRRETTFTKNRELYKQLGYLFVMQVLLIIIFLALMERPDAAIFGTVVWAVGDASAGLIGKYFGKNRYHNFIFSDEKSLQGSFAFLCSGFISLIILTLLLPVFLNDIYFIFKIFLITVVATLIEAISRDGMDTITVPLVAAAVFSILVRI
ncbi:MAG: diacylglycerol/polyprenol kinase family protein [Bacillota bacterium]